MSNFIKKSLVLPHYENTLEKIQKLCKKEIILCSTVLETFCTLVHLVSSFRSWNPYHSFKKGTAEPWAHLILRQLICMLV